MYFNGTLDPVSTRAGWTQLFEIVDQDTGEPVDLTGASIVVEVRHPHRGAVVLSATSANGKVSLVDVGTIQLSIAPAETQCLAPGSYDVGATIALNGETRQLIIGSLPIVDGIVSQ